LYDAKPKQAHKTLSPAAAEHIAALAENVSGTLGEKLKRLATLASRNK